MSSPKIERSFRTASVTRAAAVALIDAALAAAEELGYSAAVAVIDSTGTLRAFERADEAPLLTAEVSINKAWTAASFGKSTQVWNTYIEDPKVAPMAHLPRMMAVAGGCPLMDGDQLVGGIGISGGSYKQDQDAAEKALRAVGFPVPE